MQISTTDQQCATRGFLVVISLLWTGLAGAGDSIVTLRGDDPSGKHVVVVIPKPTYEASLGLAGQLATLPLGRGRLTLVEVQNVPVAERVAEFLADKLPADDPPTQVWVHEPAVAVDTAGRKVDKPTLRSRTSDHEQLATLASRALATDVAVESFNLESSPNSSLCCDTAFVYPAAIPHSRQLRFTRLLVTALLKREGMLAANLDCRWQQLRNRAPRRLVALYDAEGISGRCPPELERIAAERVKDTFVYRVCAEDIRDGALACASGIILPGGSGKKIGDALQPDGRQLLREFIKTGGGYVGICAGSFFASSGADNYMQAVQLKHSVPSGRGRSMLDIELTDDGQKIFGDFPRTIPMLYSEGPVFRAAEQLDGGDPNFVVLGRFKTPSTDAEGIVHHDMVGEAAIGAVHYGKGRILVISPHPEANEENFDFVARAIGWTLNAEAEPRATSP